MVKDETINMDLEVESHSEFLHQLQKEIEELTMSYDTESIFKTSPRLFCLLTGKESGKD